MQPLRTVAVSIAISMLLVPGGRAERVGLTDTWVENTRPVAYRIEGGSAGYFATGEICSLMKSFVVEGGGVTVKFTPKTTRRGRYVYSGNADGVDVEGRGAYEVQFDGQLAIGIVAGPGTYRLKPVAGVCRE